MRARLAGPVIVVAASLVMSVGVAEHSASPCPADPETIATPGGTFYLIRSERGLWIYEETNAHPGLQQGGMPWYQDHMSVEPAQECWDVDLTTGEQIPDPDVILF